MKLYTKSGDKGTTGLIGGTRVSKSDVRLEAYGTVDELNAQIGVLISLEPGKEHIEFLQKIQNLLFTIGSNLATDTLKTQYRTASIMKDEYITMVEKEIDRLDQNLSALEQFILPGGSRLSAYCHVCRTIARRTERRIIEMSSVYPVDNKITIYVNRLSDYFFVLSRYLMKSEEVEEIPWKKPE